MPAGAVRRPPLALALCASAVVALLLLPLAYLVIRVAGGGGRALDVLWDESTLRLVVNTVLLVAGVVVAAIVVAVPTAWLVTRTDLPGRRAWAVAVALPLVIPSYVAAFCLLGFFGERGLLQQALGVERLPDPTGYWGAVAALTLSTYPYVFLLTQAALRDMDPALEEAARSLGVARARALARVTLPAVRPSITLGSLLVALYVLSDFGVVSLMRYDSLTRAIYLQYRSLFDRTPAAVLALVLVGLTAVALAFELRTRTRGKLWRTGPGTARRARPVELGKARYPALVWCALVTGLFLALPAGVLGYWLARGIVNDRELEMPWHEALHSLGASGLAAAVTLAAALPVALLAARYPSRLSRVLERLAYAGNALPGIVIALSLVFFAARYVVAVLPDARPTGLRLRRPVLPARALRPRHRSLARRPPPRRGLPRPGTGADRNGLAGHRAARQVGRARGRGARLPLGDEGAPGDDPAPSDRLRHARDGDLGRDTGGRLLAGGGPRAPPRRPLRAGALARAR